MGGVGSGGRNIKEPSKRSRTNRQTRDIGARVVEEMVKSSQPPLDDDLYDWPNITRRWWDMWRRSPLTKDYTEEDWSELQDTALLHAMFYSLTPGSPAFFKASAQLRQRTANYGVTPLDRQRLRIQFVFAEKGEDESGTSYAKAQRTKGEQADTASSPTRSRRGPLKARAPGGPDLKAV